MPQTEGESSDRRSAKARIVNQRGLHARASAKVVEAAARFKSQVFLLKGDQKVDAESILDLMMLGAPKGTEIEVEAEGPDADEALAAMIALIEAKFGED
ncbi:MAG: HPr family phosphocarrier protein [Rhizomicrobium sp.]|jgi:phosphocarrier protein